MEKDNNLIKALLNEPGIKDTPAEDGLTGFALSLVRKNVEGVKIFLTSDLQPKNDMIFLAKEVLKLSPLRDSQLGHLQSSIKVTLTSIGVENQTASVSSARHVIAQNIPCEKFPYVNPSIEKKECYYKNKTWQECELHHSIMSNNWMVKSESLSHLVLGKFCIKAASDCADFKWMLREVVSLPCRHKKER